MTLLILLSQGKQEGKERDALTADKDLISSFCLRGNTIRDSHGFSVLLQRIGCVHFLSG